jgi:hypothetical protein
MRCGSFKSKKRYKEPETVFTTLHFLHDLRTVLVLPYTRMERLARLKHSSLLDSFVSYECIEVL